MEPNKQSQGVNQNVGQAPEQGENLQQTQQQNQQQAQQQYQQQAQQQNLQREQGQQVAPGSMQGEQGAQGTATGSQAQASAGRQLERPSVGVIRPPVDVIEDPQGITLIADLPGVSKDKLNLRLEAHSLTIEGALTLDVPQDMESRYAEVRHQHYERTFALSRELDGEKATAELAHGVLRVRIPKTAQAAPRKIQVNVAQQ